MSVGVLLALCHLHRHHTTELQMPELQVVQVQQQLSVECYMAERMLGECLVVHDECLIVATLQP
jgi:hypothetical protein